VYECALLERWVYFCVTFPALAFSYLFVAADQIYHYKLSACEGTLNFVFLIEYYVNAKT